MPRVSNRTGRVADLLKKEIAHLLQNEMRDPRVGMASVTAVRVSPDLSSANVFVTILGKSTTDEASEAVDVINQASGFLRSMLAKRISLRITPRLNFIFDDSLVKGQQLSSLIDEALAQDSTHPQDDSE